jgi:hypothetical protein
LLLRYGEEAASDDPKLPTIHFSPATTGRIFPAAIFSSARSRSFSSLLSNRPSRYSQRRKSSALRSPFSELHSEQLETRLP